MSRQAIRIHRAVHHEVSPGPAGALAGRENELEFRGTWRRLKKDCFLLAILMLLPLAGAFLYIVRGPKQFAAMATLEARPVNPQPSGDDVFGKILSDGPLSGLSDVDIATAQAKLLHYDFLMKVASDPALQSGMLNEIATPRRSASGKPISFQAGIAAYLEKNVKVTRIRGTRLMDLVCVHRDPGVAALMANRFVQVIMSDGLSSREAFSSGKIDGLEQDFRKVESRLDEAQRRVALYLPSVDIREALKEARNEVKLLSGRYGERHPTMMAAVAVSSAHQDGLRAELEKLRHHPMEAGYWEGAIGPASHAGPGDTDQAETLLTGRYEALTSEVAALRSLSESLNVRLNALRIANSKPDLDLRIAQEAVAEAARQVAPNKKFAVAAGVIIGLLCVLLRIIALGNPPARIRSAEDWSDATSLPLLGLVSSCPRSEPPSQMLNAADGSHPLAEQIRSVRCRLFWPASAEPSVLLITSPLREEGKSSFAAALALSLARIDPAGVVLVEMDLRDPCVHKTLDLPNFLGMSDVLTGKCSFDDGLTVIDGLMVMTGGSSEKEALHHLGGTSVVSFMQQLKRRFRHVILDSPAVLLTSDAKFIAPLCDEVLLVINAKTTRVSAIHAAESEIASVHAVIRGGILNDVSRASRHDGFSFRPPVDCAAPPERQWQHAQPAET